MSDGLNKLKAIGAQKIHEETHIAKQHTQAILHESYDDMTKIQFLGFISILEREYSVDLDDLKQGCEEYYANGNIHQNQEKKVFVSPQKKKSYTLVYLAVVAIIFVMAILFSMNSSSSVSETAKTDLLDNKAIEDAKENIKISDPDVVFEVADVNVSLEDNATFDKNVSVDKNMSVDSNLSLVELNVTVDEVDEPEIVELKVVEPKLVATSLKIIADAKLWLGYMDLETKQKKQKTFIGEFDLDPKKDWLLSLGHGYVNVNIDGNITEFKSKYNIKLLYKDANITKISFEEYKVINKGPKW